MPAPRSLLPLSPSQQVLPMNTGVEGGETAIKLARRWGYDVKVGWRRARCVVLRVARRGEGVYPGRVSPKCRPQRCHVALPAPDPKPDINSRRACPSTRPRSCLRGTTSGGAPPRPSPPPPTPTRTRRALGVPVGRHCTGAVVASALGQGRAGWQGLPGAASAGGAVHLSPPRLDCTCRASAPSCPASR